MHGAQVGLISVSTGSYVFQFSSAESDKQAGVEMSVLSPSKAIPHSTVYYRSS